MPHVYKVTNLITNKSYIGATITTVKARWNRHKSDAKHNRDNQALHAAIRKYGPENFKVETIETHDDINHVFNSLEPKYIKEHKTYGNDGYNMTHGGDGWNNMKHKPESIEKMRAAKLGKKHTKEAKDNMSKAQMGKTPWNKGKICPSISDAKRGKLLSIEHKKILSNNRKGTIHSEETKKKIQKNNSSKHKLLNLTTNEIIEISNLNQFCKENNISAGSLMSFGHTKNFKLLESTQKVRKYIIKDINTNETFETDNLKKFSDSKNISNAGLLSKYKQNKPYTNYQIVEIEITEQTKTYK